MKTNPNNLPESGWSVKSDGSDRVPNLVPREYMPKIGEYIGINERGTVQVDTEPFGQLLTLSEFERLSKPVIDFNDGQISAFEKSGGLMSDLSKPTEVHKYKYCQSKIEGHPKCLTQCEQCKGYYKPLENPEPVKSETVDVAMLESMGYKKLPFPNILQSMILDIGRNRILSFGNVGTPNETLWISEVNRTNPTQIDEIVCLHNYDYDGFMTVSRLKLLHEGLKLSTPTPEPEFCTHCNKRKRMKGDGTIEKLCEC